MKNTPLIVICVFASVFTSLIVTSVVPEEISPYTSGDIIEASTLDSLQNSLRNIVADVSPSVVSIIASREYSQYEQDPYGYFYERSASWEIGGGTGVIVSEDGHILTNKHVVSDPTLLYVVVTSD